MAQVKLSSTRFAQFVSWLSVRCNMTFDMDEIHSMENALIFDVPESKVREEDVNELLFQMNNPDGFIPAIKAYRVLTGAGLKEAKEAVERYRNANKLQTIANYQPATLSDILGKVGKNG